MFWYSHLFRNFPRCIVIHTVKGFVIVNKEEIDVFLELSSFFIDPEYWRGLPFPSPVDHILSDLSTMTRLSWVAPRARLSFIELDKAVVLVWLDWLVFCEYGFMCLPSDAFSQHLPS